jgi:hypothetical protein
MRGLLDNYEGLLNKVGTKAYVGSDPDAAALASAHEQVMLNLKNLYQLGALSESDLEIMRNALGSAIGPRAKLNGTAPILSQIGQVRKTLDTIGSAYGASSAAPAAATGAPDAPRTQSVGGMQSPADLWETLRSHGMSPEQATAAVHSILKGG